MWSEAKSVGWRALEGGQGERWDGFYKCFAGVFHMFSQMRLRVFFAAPNAAWKRFGDALRGSVEPWEGSWDLPGGPGDLLGRFWSVSETSKWLLGTRLS